MNILFFVSISILSYTWIFYIFILFIISRFYPAINVSDNDAVSITVLLTVHNEEDLIERRIENLLSQDYPKELLEVLVASDGSTDKTNQLVASFRNLDNRLKLCIANGGGKSATQNFAIYQATGDIIILTDAATIFQNDTIKKIAGSFTDEKVGCASGRLILNQKTDAVAQSQGLYWKMETVLRRMESRIGILHTCSGQIMAFRKKIFRPFSAKYGDDCIIPINIILQGYKVVHNDLAIAYDTFPSSIKSEFKARVRMTLRNITCTFSSYKLFNPFKYPLISIAIFSHKILRWLTPFFMLSVLFSNFFLFSENSIYSIFAFLQCFFYFLGLIGFIAELLKTKVPIASPIFSFILANIGFFMGVLKAILGEKITSYKNDYGCKII